MTTSMTRWQVLALQRHRGRRHAIGDRAGRGDDLDRVDGRLVVRQVRIEQRLQRIAHRRLHRIEGKVDVAGHLRRGAGEVEDDALAGLAHLERELDVALLQPVVVEHVLEAIAAVGNGGDAGPHAPGGALQDLAEGASPPSGAVAGDELLHALDARGGRRRSAR